jgi:hypothetical protein
MQLTCRFLACPATQAVSCIGKPAQVRGVTELKDALVQYTISSPHVMCCILPISHTQVVSCINLVNQHGSHTH